MIGAGPNGVRACHERVIGDDIGMNVCILLQMPFGGNP